jgi:hypothetical protein
MKKDNRKRKNHSAVIKEIVEEILKRRERVELADIVDIIRPLYTFKKADLVEKELKSKARYIMRSIKDGKGIRTFFADEEGVYINVEKSTDLVDLSKVNRQINRKYSGIVAAMDKVRRRIQKITQKFLLK